MVREHAGGPDLSFEEQFSRREEVAPGVFAVDLIPSRQVSVPVYLNIGWNSRIEDYVDSLRLAFDSNRRILCTELPDESEEQKADQILAFLKGKGITKADFVAHSVGAISAALAVLKGSTVVEKLTLINPASLIPDDSPKDLIRRYRSLLQQIPGVARQAETGSTQKIFDMARTITGFDMNDVLGRIASGIKILAVQAEEDTLFPKDRTSIDERVERLTIPGGHYSVGRAMPLAL